MPCVAGDTYSAAPSAYTKDIAACPVHKHNSAGAQGFELKSLSRFALLLKQLLRIQNHGERVSPFFVSETNEKVQEHHLFAAFEELQQDGRMANETLIEQSEENNSDKMSKDTTTRKTGRNFRLISMPLMTTRLVYKILDPSICH